MTVQINNDIKDDDMGNKTFPAWSHSRLVVGETCHYRAFFQYKQKIPEPERPPLPNGKEYPNDRGTRIHDESETYVRGNGPLPPESAKHFTPEFEKLREYFNDGKVILEDAWTFDDAWRPLEPLGAFPKGKWPAEFAERFYQIWLRVKLDACVFLSPREAVAIDYKSGRRFGNEVKHGEQLQLYTLATLIRYPKVEKVTTEAWYLDQNELASMTFTRKQGLRYLRGFNDRGQAFTGMKDFKPDPNAHNCRYCPYKTGMMGKSGVMGTGHCKYNPE